MELVQGNMTIDQKLFLGGQNMLTIIMMCGAPKLCGMPRNIQHIFGIKCYGSRQLGKNMSKTLVGEGGNNKKIKNVEIHSRQDCISVNPRIILYSERELKL